MAYSSTGGKLPFESASKLGHLKVIESEWVNSLIRDFEINDLGNEALYDNNIWNDFNINSGYLMDHLLK